MAELAVIASVVGLLGAGTKLSVAIFDFAATLGSAASELQTIGTEVTLFCSVIKQLQSTMSHASFRYSSLAVEAVQEIVDRCRVIFGEIDEIINGLRKSQGTELIPSVNFISKVKWTFKKSKVQLLRSTLESCKITLHIMLTTMEVAQKVSTRKSSTAETMIEDKQIEKITQSLIMSQQSAIDRLEILEDESEIEGLPVNKRLGHRVQAPVPNLAKKGRRLSRLLGGLSITTPSMEPQQVALPSREQRASVWLNGILFGDEPNVVPHPGSKLRKRFSSVDTEGKPLELLRKWTDQAERHNRLPLLLPEDLQPQVALFQKTENLFSEPTVSAKGSIEHTRPHSVIGIKQMSTSWISPTATQNLPRAPTIPISPTTVRTTSIDISASSIALGLPKSLPTVDDTEKTALQIMSKALENFRLRQSPETSCLCIAYGGKIRILKPTESLFPIMQQYEELGLDPHMFIRKTGPGDVT